MNSIKFSVLKTSSNLFCLIAPTMLVIEPLFETGLCIVSPSCTFIVHIIKKEHHTLAQKYENDGLVARATSNN